MNFQKIHTYAIQFLLFAILITLMPINVLGVEKTNPLSTSAFSGYEKINNHSTSFPATFSFPTPPHQFPRFEPISHLEPDISFIATNFYGPVELWWKKTSNGIEKYTITRKIPTSDWEIIGEVTSDQREQTHNYLHYEDIIYAKSGSMIYYRVTSRSQTAINRTRTMKIYYSPLASTSLFHGAAFDKIEQKMNLNFQLAQSGDVRIDLFSKDAQWEKCLVERTLNSGNYSLLINTKNAETEVPADEGFCRLRFRANKGEYSFIQIQAIRPSTAPEYPQ